MHSASPSEGLQLQLCGGLSLWTGERQRVALPRKAAALMAYLILEPGPHTRAFLATLLWADSDEAHAAMSLRQALSKLRDMCGEALVADRTVVSIRRDVFGAACHCDVIQFLAQIDTHPMDACAVDVHLFLNDVASEDAQAFLHWSDRTRARLVRLAVTSLARTVQDALARRDHALALMAAERWMALVPHSSDAACLAIDAAIMMHDDARARTIGEHFLRERAHDGNGMDADVERVRSALQRLNSVRWNTPGVGTPAVRTSSAGRRPTATSALSTIGLCERDDAWSAVGAVFEDVSSNGHSAAVTLVGGIGAGRTRLMQDLSALFGMRGAVLLAAASPSHVPVLPYGAVSALLRHMMHQPALGGLNEGALQTFRVLAPELEERFAGLRRSTGQLSATDTTFAIRLQEALTQALQLIAEDATIVIALDDAMWYDRESATVLQAVALRTMHHPVLWLLTGADDPGQERSNPSWAEVVRQSHSVELAPLSVEAIEQMFCDLSRILVGWRPLAECVHHGSHGIPGYVQHTVHRLQDSWGPISAEWQARIVPAACLPPLATRVQQHVESLDEVARTVLLSLAMVMEQGHPVPKVEWHRRPALTLDQLSHMHGISRLRAGILGQRLVELGLATEADGGFRCVSPVLVEYMLRTGSALVRDELRRILALVTAPAT